MNVEAMRSRLEELQSQFTPGTFSPRCGRCEDLRFVEVDADDGVKRVARCLDCSTHSVRGLPAPFESSELSGVREYSGNRLALRAAAGFLTSGRDLYLCGPTGVGKTLIAVATARAFVVQARQSGLFVRWPYVIHQLQPRALSDEAHRQLEQDLCTVPLLVIDDVGAERAEATDFTRRLTLFVYEARGDAGLRTIVTSNLTPKELAIYQGDERLASRIAERCDVVGVEGNDQRLRRMRALR